MTIKTEINRPLAEYMGFPKVKSMTVWDYDKSLDNSIISIGLVVNDVNEQGVCFQQWMPFKRYGLSYFDGKVFKPHNVNLRRHAPCRDYENDMSLLMEIVCKAEEGDIGFKMCRKVVEIYKDSTKEMIVKIKGRSRQEALYEAVQFWVAYAKHNPAAPVETKKDYESTVRNNLMYRPMYTPYCGSTVMIKGNTCSWPRTKWNGSQFHCPECGWVSNFPPEFIEEYKKKWNK